jgi:methyl-accepting chemotaxis protein
MSPFARIFSIGYWSVATRIAVACVGIALVFAGAVTAIGYVKASAGLNEQANSRLESDAVIVTTAVDQWTGAHMDLSHSIARLPVVIRFLDAGDAATPADFAAVADISNAIKDGATDVTGVTLIDAKGIARFSQTASIIGTSLAQRDYFQNAIKGTDYITGVSRTTSDGSPRIFVAAPVRAADGRIVGTISASGDPLGLQKMLDAEQKRTGTAGKGLLIDEQGLIVANTVNPDWLLRPVVALSPAALQAAQTDKRWGNSPAPDPLGEQGLAPAVGATQRVLFNWNTQGVSYHAVAMPLSRTHWTYVTALPTAAFEAATQDLLRTSAVAVAIGVVLAFLATLLLTRPITDGLRRLTAAANGLAKGDTDQELNLAGHDEIGQMAVAFREVMAYQRAMADVADTVADGDLTRNIEPQSARDVLGTSFKRMIANLRDLVGQVQESAVSLANTSAQLGSAAAQTGSAVQQVTMAVQNVASGAQETSRSAQETTASVTQLSQVIDGIARGATDQARQVHTTSSTASQMAAGIEQVAANATQMAGASQQTRTAAELGGQAVRETTAAMTEIQLVVGQAASKVRELGTLGQKIGAVVETIDDIAEQTNLLALNAAIEAARAGEHGKGFAVVADEVRKLAERSGRETKQIAELIAQVQTGTKEAVAAMDSGAARVELGSAKAEQAGQALEEILKAVQDTVRQVGEIASSSQQMAHGARSVTDAMMSISAVVEESSASTEQMAAQASAVTGSVQSIAAVSEEQSAATEEVSASTEQMSAQVEQMSAQAQELASTAEQLKDLVARFKLDNGTSAARPSKSAPITKVASLRRAA